MSNSFIIKKNKKNTSNWSGGKTTELYIYPENSQFKNLDFLFRISTASIEIDESTFTSLPNIKRNLLLLDGKLKLNHKDHHNITLNKFQNDKFDGSWITKSEGRAIDFNFMSSKNLNEKINTLQFSKNVEYSDRNVNSFSCIYLYQGKVESSNGMLNEGDIWVSFEKEINDFKIIEKSILIHLTLDLN